MSPAGGQNPDQARPRTQVQDHVACSKGKMAREEHAAEFGHENVAGDAEQAVVVEKEMNRVVACHVGLPEGK